MADFKNIGIVGAGSMGIGIAQIASTAGCSVLLYDNNSAAAEKSLNSLEKVLFRLVEKGKITSIKKEEILANIQIINSLENWLVSLMALDFDSEVKRVVPKAMPIIPKGNWAILSAK